jgi:hypothetical protein
MISKRRGPSYLKRIDSRAHTLSQDRRFHSYLDYWRQQWNELYPGFVVSGSGSLPDRIETSNSLPVPVTLGEAIGHVDAVEKTEASWIHQALDHWKQISHVVSLNYWPEEDFPHTLGGHHHPAMPFVALCLMYDPRLVDAEMVGRHTLKPIRLGYDPNHPETAPAIAMSLGQYRHLVQNIYQAIEEGRGMSHAELVFLRSAARNAGWEAFYEATELFDSSDPEAGWFVIPVIPGLTTQDVRDAEYRIVERSTRIVPGGDFVRHRVRECLAVGQSHSAIARRLGISRATVASIAKEREPARI